MKIIGTMIMAGLMIAGGTASLANDRPEGTRPDRVRARKAERTCGQDEKDGYRRQCRDAREAHQQTRRDAGRTAMDAARNTEDPHEALAILRAHRVSQFAADQAFHDRQWQQHEQHVAAKLEERGMSEDDRAAVLEKMRNRREKAGEKAQAHQSRILERLDDLAAKEDLTHQDIVKAVRKAIRQHARRRNDGDGPGNRRDRKPRRGPVPDAPDA